MAPLTCLLVARVAEAVHQNNRSKQMTLLLLALDFVGLGIAASNLPPIEILGQDILPPHGPAQSGYHSFSPVSLQPSSWAFGRDIVSLCVLQVGVLLAILGLARGLVRMDSQLSARGVNRSRTCPLQSAPANKLFVHDLTRGMRYGLKLLFSVVKSRNGGKNLR